MIKTTGVVKEITELEVIPITITPLANFKAQNCATLVNYTAPFATECGFASDFASLGSIHPIFPSGRL